MISDIEERLSLHGFSGAPVNFFDHYYSEDGRELKKIVSALNDQDFNDLLINVGISVLGSNGDVRFLRSLIAYRASLSAS